MPLGRFTFGRVLLGTVCLGLEGNVRWTSKALGCALGFLFAISLFLAVYYALGSEIVKVEPLAGALLTSIAPSKEPAIFLAIASPKPYPSA
jgi:hypothetical protein